MKVENVVISDQKEKYKNIEKLFSILNKRNINLIVVNMGDIIKIVDNLYFDILWPDKSDLISYNSINNNSIICKLNYKNFSVLFTGDIEKIAEEKFLLEYKDNKDMLNSTVLKAAHHGSNTSSTEGFIEAVKPKIILVGVGKNNKFGHPSLDVINRFISFGAKVFRTDKDGEIKIVVNGKGEIIELNKYVNNLES